MLLDEKRRCGQPCSSGEGLRIDSNQGRAGALSTIVGFLVDNEARKMRVWRLLPLLLGSCLVLVHNFHAMTPGGKEQYAVCKQAQYSQPVFHTEFPETRPSQTLILLLAALPDRSSIGTSDRNSFHDIAQEHNQLKHQKTHTLFSTWLTA